MRYTDQLVQWSLLLVVFIVFFTQCSSSHYIDELQITESKVAFSESVDEPYKRSDKRIIYICGYNNYYQFCSMNWDGSDQQRLTSTTETIWTPSISHSRGLILYSKLNKGIWGISSTGERVGYLIRRFGLFPSFSPDDSEVVMISGTAKNREIYTYSISKRMFKRLTNNRYQEESPSYSPDGKLILFAVVSKNSGVIYTMDLQGKNWKALTPKDQYSYQPSYSANGKEIVYVSKVNGHHQIFTMNSNGSSKKMLTRGNYQNIHPVFSPNNKWIAFSSYRNKNWDIYLMKSDGSGLKRLTTHGQDEFKPIFTR